MYETDTIAAAATAMGNSGIGIIRISGEDSFSIAERIFLSADKNNKLKIENFRGYSVHYGYVHDGGTIIDEVLILVMKAPHSYTAENTVEIDCHGGRFIMQKILDTVIKNGARPADPGEFTKRAFLNGRIDLTQAESVMDIIQSQNSLAAKSAVFQLKGSVNKKIREIRSDILYENAYLEAALDDPEHMSLDGFSERLYIKIDNLINEIQKLADSYDSGRILKEGVRTAIIGKPNAGKSTLMNALLGRERAIVTDIEGTTRDVLEEQLMLGDLSIVLLDTAGIRETENVIEKMGVDRAKEETKDADLILYVADSSVCMDSSDRQIMEMLDGKNVIILLNKSDLQTVTTKEDLVRKSGGKYPIIEISAANNTGIEELEHMIREMFINEKINFNDEIIITNARQKNCLVNAAESLRLVKKAIEDGIPEDFYSVDLNDAYTSLGYIIGEETGEDLINEVFDKFCMGK